jgi:hypothetical protein
MPGTKITAKIDRTREEWKVECAPRTESDVASIVEAIKDGKRKRLSQRVIETIVTEPIKALFAALVGIAVAVALWYFGLSP